MQNSGPLVPFGLAVIVLTALLIVVPYLRRKSDAVTVWNLFLFGGAIFMGIGSLEVAYGDFHWPELKWFQPNREDVQIVMLGAVAFYAVLLGSYYLLKFPRRVAARFLNKWPPLSAGLTFLVVGLCLTISVVAPLAKGVVFLGPLFSNVSHKAVLFATVFSFCHWHRNRFNFVMLVLFLAVYSYACMYSILVFVGRRLLLTVAVSPLVCIYWMDWRYRPPKYNLIRLAIASLIMLGVAAFYGTFRHISLGAHAQERTVSTIVGAVKELNTQRIVGQITKDWMHYFSQYAMHNSLLTIHLVNNHMLAVDPLNTLRFVAVYPIPRAIWPGKPQAMGVRIVNEVLHLPYKTNWGLGIVGHGYQEGGYLVIMFYAFLVVLGIRLIDDALVRRPDNPFLLAILCSSSFHVIAWIRGDPTPLTAEILEAIAFAWGLGLILRFLYGTDRTPVCNSGPASASLVSAHQPRWARM